MEIGLGCTIQAFQTDEDEVDLKANENLVLFFIKRHR